jgi:peroxiredoxin
MARTPSTMRMPLGAPAPPFELEDPSGRRHSLAGLDGAPALLVAFICPHCPFVQHVRAGFAALCAEYQKRGVAVVAIASNDVGQYPQDGPEGMAAEAKEAGYTFPYLFDETQEVAKAYGAACTPDFFVFDRERRLAYRGQMDGSRPGNGVPVTGEDLRRALDALLERRPVPAEQRPSLGCNIKWKPGNEPAYFAAE